MACREPRRGVTQPKKQNLHMAVPSNSAFAEFRARNRRFDQNRGSWADWPDRYGALCRMAVELGPRAVGEMVPYLFARATDERNLRLAWDRSAQVDHAGEDGDTCATYSGSEFEYVRWLRDWVRGEEYTPGPTIPLRIRKRSGVGTRLIQVHNLCDRLVQRGLVQVLGPLLDARFDQGCLAYRPGLSRYHGLAHVQRLVLAGHTVLLAGDLKDAFDSVPQRRLMDILRRTLRPSQGLPQEQQKYRREMHKLFRLLDKVLINSTGMGIPQGAPISALMLNVYLNHLVDQPWRRNMRELPLLRYSDDILICCRSSLEAEGAWPILERRVGEAGMKLKRSGPAGEAALHDLSRGNAVEWLGFEIRLGTAGMEVRIGRRGWESLESKLLLSAIATNPLDAIAACLREAGPAYPFEDRRALYERIERTAGELQVREIPAREFLEEAWLRAYRRWLHVRHQVIQ
jgi:retron-type reverse transcriptase